VPVSSASPADLQAVTILETLGGRPCNKLVTRLPDGGIDKRMHKNPGAFKARTVPTPTLEALADAVREVTERPDALLSMSIFLGHAEFEVQPMSVIARALGVDPRDREAIAGWHDFGGELPVCARMKENAVLSCNLLTDRDIPDGMPADMAGLAEDEHDAALDVLLPGFAACGKVRVPSTSGRLVIDGVLGTALSGHAIVQVTDPDLIEVKWQQAMLRSLVAEFPLCKLAFAKPVRDRKGGTGKVLRHDWWPIVDRCTWALARPVFEGQPIVKGPGLEVAPSVVRTIPGGLLDLSRVADLTKEELEQIREAIRQIKGVKPTIKLDRRQGARGRSPVIGVVIRVADLDWGRAGRRAAP
jgi:hypothetical protein